MVEAIKLCQPSLPACFYNEVWLGHSHSPDWDVCYSCFLIVTEDVSSYHMLSVPKVDNTGLFTRRLLTDRPQKGSVDSSTYLIIEQMRNWPFNHSRQSCGTSFPKVQKFLGKNLTLEHKLLLGDTIPKHVTFLFKCFYYLRRIFQKHSKSCELHITVSILVVDIKQ